jgi:hypothetical protein
LNLIYLQGDSGKADEYTCYNPKEVLVERSSDFIQSCPQLSVARTLSGGANDVWIFQIAENLTVNNSAAVTLVGGAQAKNIFWQVSGQAIMGTAADFKGILLSQTLISLNTGVVMTGRALTQTAVTLNATAITAP